MSENSPNGYKTLREKEKLLVTSNFSFSHSVFIRLVLQTRKNQGLFGKGLSKSVIILYILTLSQTSPGFYVFWKHYGKRRNCSLRAISPFFHTAFYPFGELLVIFVKLKIVVCKLRQFGRVQNLSSGKNLQMTISNLTQLEESYPYRLWEKEKLLVTSNFSFSYCVFQKTCIADM